MKNVGAIFMKIASIDLLNFASMALSIDVRKYNLLSKMLHSHQPYLCKKIDEIAIDPRCARAYSFCTIYCALLLQFTENIYKSRFKKYSSDLIHETAGRFARYDFADAIKSTITFRNRVFRWAIKGRLFDDDDSTWLCTTISAFLFLLENSEPAVFKRQYGNAMDMSRYKSKSYLSDHTAKAKKQVAGNLKKSN
jgi:hypothetical protein